jgi:hypothetical protein
VWLVVVEYIYLTLVVLAAVCWLIGYILHLDFGRDVLRETHDSASLKDAAEYTRSYRSANFKSLADAIAKLFGRGRRPPELGQAVEHHGSALRCHSTAQVHILRDRRTGVAELVGDLPGAESSLVEQCCRRFP